MEVCAISLKLRKHVTFIVAWFMDHRRHRQVLLQGRDIEEGSTRGRKQVWFSNIPHTWLVADKGGQNWITKAKGKFTFPGGGSQFIHRASQYLDQIFKMVPSGSRTRVFLDVGFGVTSFGPYLISREFEHGVPAMVATNLTPAIIQCSRCRINSTCDGELRDGGPSSQTDHVGRL
ncbi:probable methyltransferase PMT10 isoform X1 [Triticum aestivum]|uniref:probable methyltransferase PMT10 isoform X1 n=1 Tax=Triticum aestivum TaxID=4565 RepID=UPI001D01FCEC|nr:probable methyltransferase PMT10 isoform X1 [Triticum aestivum]XP_044324166.1 probable methyltransferase PMT10 isoform X1 [Triticum aestivum]XP_044324172.1 probable methyltransferase PMT10 isoform X1 [Triticum aestivum]XP_044324177.1 probable methyltransferase PMT10 isoform X1 [Triticum aestivum]XP_044324178.1 probable methyltransferase PMT10 isoform X1 [Triticum aestivum]XP_044324185.1 probable methyltransferase PMT10 isoform X1 [Triticum aestivum]XP_044324191.1 probable methyltransferase